MPCLVMLALVEPLSGLEMGFTVSEMHDDVRKYDFINAVHVINHNSFSSMSPIHHVTQSLRAHSNFNHKPIELF
jgi:hypothetical protein